MKRICLLSIGIMLRLYAFAQRERLTPDDYTDHSNFDPVTEMGWLFPLVILVALVIIIIWAKSSISSSRKKEIQEKKVFLTNINLSASSTALLGDNTNFISKTPHFFEEIDGKVEIPKYSKCIILEYVPDNHSFVKVKFDKYPTPLFVPRWHLRTPEDIDK
jgi:hypothetical protein